MQEVADDERLVDVELELAVHATNGGSNVVAHNLGADHGQSLALGRVNLARHDTATRLVLREAELAETAARAAAEVTDILSDLGERTSECVKATVGLNDGIMSGKSLELVGSGLKLGTSHLRDLLGDGFSEAFECVDASTDSGTTLGKQTEVGKGALNTLDAIIKLGNVAGELLSKGQGSGILQVRTSNLDDLLSLEVLDLGLEGVAQAVKGGEELVLDLEHGGDVHYGGESIVRGGAAVDVVIGVDGLLAAHLAAEDLNSPVGDDLVGVHVGLGTGTGLPDDEGEVIQELAVGNLLGSLLNSLANLLIYIQDKPSQSQAESTSGVVAIGSIAGWKLTETVAHVDSGGSALEDTESLDDRRGHAILGLVDLEVLEGSLSLSSPVFVPGDLDLAKGIALGTCRSHLVGRGVEGSRSCV